jgi:hypothetical protein
MTTTRTIPNYRHDPDAELVYGWDWSAWLDTDTIATHTIVAPDEVTVEADAHTTTAVSARLSAPTAVVGDVFTVTCRITTAGGETDDRSIKLRIVDR